MTANYTPSPFDVVKKPTIVITRSASLYAHHLHFIMEWAVKSITSDTLSPFDVVRDVGMHIAYIPHPILVMIRQWALCLTSGHPPPPSADMSDLPHVLRV